MTSMSESTQHSPVEAVAIVAHARVDVTTAVEQVREVAARAGVEVVDEPEWAQLTVAVGGDGTILRTLARLLGTDVPVIGVNFGRVGFLASITPERLEADLARVFAGEYRVVEQPTLEAQLDGKTFAAVNDVVAASSTLGRMIELSWAIARGGSRRRLVRRDDLLDAFRLDRVQPLERGAGARARPRRDGDHVYRAAFPRRAPARRGRGERS